MSMIPSSLKATWSKSPIRSAIFTIAISLVANFVFVPSAANAVTQQKISFYINGDCSDYYDEEGEYAFFEEEAEWTCYMSVVIKPITPKRTIRLQYWSGKKWVEESKSTTGTKGTGYLDFDPYCNDGSYCDGSWKYRIVVDASGAQKSKISPSFYIVYYAGAVDEYNEDYSYE